MENKKFTQNLNPEDLIAYNCHLIDKKNKSSIMVPLLGIFTTALGIYSLFQEGSNIVTSILYILLGLFVLFFLKKILGKIQKKSVRKQITNNFSKVDMEVTVMEEGIRFEIIDDEKENEEEVEVETKKTELSDDELRELDRYGSTTEEVKKEETIEEKKEEVKVEDNNYTPIELPNNFSGKYEGIFNNDNYSIDISDRGIYISLNGEERKEVEIIKINEESIDIKFMDKECKLFKNEINDPNSLLKMISPDNLIYVNFGKIEEEQKEEETEEVTQTPQANALLIPWGGISQVEEENEYIFINMLGYEAMIIKKSSCEEINEVIEIIKEKLNDPKQYVDKQN